jgi:hypothetical protein
MNCCATFGKRKFVWVKCTGVSDVETFKIIFYISEALNVITRGDGVFTRESRGIFLNFYSAFIRVCVGRLWSQSLHQVNLGLASHIYRHASISAM